MMEIQSLLGALIFGGVLIFFYRRSREFQRLWRERHDAWKELGLSPKALQLVMETSKNDRSTWWEEFEESGKLAFVAGKLPGGPGPVVTLFQCEGYFPVVPKIDKLVDIVGYKLDLILDQTLGLHREHRPILESEQDAALLSNEQKEALYACAWREPVDWRRKNNRIIKNHFKSNPLLKEIVQETEKCFDLEELIKIFRDETPDYEAVRIMHGQYSYPVTHDETPDYDAARIDPNAPSWKQIALVLELLYDKAERTRPSYGKGPMTEEGKAYRDVANEIRDAMRAGNKQYDAALKVEESQIDKEEVYYAAYGFFDNWEYEDVFEFFQNVPKKYKDVIKFGIRDFIDAKRDDCKNTLKWAMVIDYEDGQISEINKYKKILTSVNRQKMTIVIGKKNTEDLLSAIEQEVIGFQLQVLYNNVNYQWETLQPQKT